MPNLRKKQQEYQMKYGDIPIDYKERLNWMCDKYKLSANDMDYILFAFNCGCYFYCLDAFSHNSNYILLYKENTKRSRH